jgi:hypothetical protein
MNERIEKLALQAGFKYIKDEGIGWAGNYNASLPQFAQLIVRECCAICQDVDGEDNIDARSARQDCAVEIREHFGVEE